MPRIVYGDVVIDCEPGERLRDVLLRAGLSPHNGRARLLNCRGIGTCGTCAVAIEGGPLPELNRRETWRLGFPPHNPESGLRLACQIPVEGDLVVRKYPGFWGQHVTPEED